MIMAKLKPIILKRLIDKTGMEESSIRSALSRKREEYPYLTLNACAQLFARERNFSVTRHLDPEDRQALSNLETKKITVPITQRKKHDEIIVKIAVFETEDTLLEKHIDEINRACTHKCYTATFVLCRKVLENLILQILQKKYPDRTEDHRAKYLNLKNGRIVDFGVLLKNLRDSANDFIPKKKLVERICQLSEGFKDDANDMTHSLYHIASKKEIDENNFQYILDLIRTLNTS